MNNALKKLINALVAVAESTFAAFEDDKWTSSDIMEFLDDIPEIVSVLNVIGELPEAIKELADGEKRLEAINYLKEEFDIENDKAEALIESIFQNLSEIITGLSSIIGAIKAFKE